MKLFGFNISRSKALNPVNNWQSGKRWIFEPYAGAWQKNKEETRGTVLAYTTLYACLNRISQDIGKLPFLLKDKRSDGIEVITENVAYSPVLRKPNTYQTAQQFREAWALSRMIHGNTYVLKGRDQRNVVTKLYVLDPCRVMPLVSDSGDVFYRINYSSSENLLPDSYPAQELIIPAREIIHDRLNCFHHQLIGVPPLCAAYWPAVKNLRILKSSAEFFANNAQPGGILTAPAGMSETDANRVRDYWQTAYTGTNSGKVAVIGADMKFTSFAIKSVDAQLVEQMRYSDEQICQPFGIPPFKIGIGQIPAGLGVDAINLLYYDDALSGPIESMENLLDEGLGLPSNLSVWMDIDRLLRMDLGKQAEVETMLVKNKIKTPDEARRRFNLSPTGGGDTLWGQHQDYPLGVLAEREDVKPLNALPAPEEEPTDEDAEAIAKKVKRALPTWIEPVHDSNTIEAVRELSHER